MCECGESGATTRADPSREQPTACSGGGRSGAGVGSILRAAPEHSSQRSLRPLPGHLPASLIDSVPRPRRVAANCAGGTSLPACREGLGVGASGASFFGLRGRCGLVLGRGGCGAGGPAAGLGAESVGALARAPTPGPSLLGRGILGALPSDCGLISAPAWRAATRGHCIAVRMTCFAFVLIVSSLAPSPARPLDRHPRPRYFCFYRKECMPCRLPIIPMSAPLSFIGGRWGLSGA